MSETRNGPIFSIAAAIDAACESVAIKPDPQTGRRPGDPLEALIPDALNADPDALYVARSGVEALIRRPVSLVGPGNMAARLRAGLRRWAMREARDRTTLDVVRIAADALAISARELGLIRENETLHVEEGTDGTPWGVVVMEPAGPGKLRRPTGARPSFLSHPIGSTATEAHAVLVSALVALRAASWVDRARILGRDYHARVSAADRDLFEHGEISTRALQRRVNAPKED